jgi:hypothetical protein
MADLKQTLARLTDNLNTLKEREAKYSGDTPVVLLKAQLTPTPETTP